ncbi:hypothetical protein [Bacteroides sp.]|uniref:hypothetical protein n=1 Tax=Bacteroides sp. TaxID=29523 RepID=UPI00262B7AAF|nr:hypothetical protein [Bacteroides sp.]
MDTSAPKHLIDSLETRCNDRIMQTDSLRLEAENFMQHTRPGTSEYFHARQFYINSYFNEKDYDRVLQLLAETEQMTGYKDLPGTQADYLYTRSRCYQFTGRYDEAITISRQIMDLVPAPGDTLAHENIRSRAVGAMNNVNNIFYFTDRTAAGADWFFRLRRNPPALLKECCLRDMMIFEGYLRGLAKQPERAEAVMDSARALPVYRKTAENTFRDCSFAASVYYSLPHRQEEMERLLKYAISEGRKDGYIPGVQWAMNLLGMRYDDLNRFQDAIQLQYQGLEIGAQLKDTALYARCYYGLSKLYYKWTLYPQAKYYIDKCLQWKESNLITTTDLGGYYLMQSIIRQKIPGYKREKLLQTLALADSCSNFTPAGKSRKSLIALNKAYEWIMDRPYEPQKGLEQIDKYYEQENQVRRGSANALRTIALIRLGRKAEARNALLSIEEYSNLEYFECLDTLMNHYLGQNDEQAILHLTRLREPLLKGYMEQKARETMIGADVRYKTVQKEQQNQLLTAEVALKSSRMQTIVILGCALLLLLSAGFLIRQRTLKLRLRLRAQEQEFSEKQLQEQAERLRQLIASRQELNTHNEDLLRQLAEVQSTRDKSCDLDSVLEKLQPRLFTREEEESFRRAFASLYPSVLHKLRSICANVTRSEELLCMLIVLKQTNEEISRTLGISRSTVLQNRYRLRVKLGLPEGVDIDAEVQAMLLTS